MSSIIKFTPLSGAHSENPLCYLLEIDDYCILLDCGWNDSFDLSLLKPLSKIVSKINVVLLSHPDLNHLGALPYAVGKLGLKAKIFGTNPTVALGERAMYDAYISRHAFEDFATFDLDDVDETFAKCIQLKYSEHRTITENGVTIEITPFAAGHTLGGTIWQIKTETDSIVYAVDYNHKKERHLNPTVLETLHPTVLITDALNALNTNLIARRTRDTTLYDSILSTLNKGGNVLCPVETSRSLELMLVLERYWHLNNFPFPLIFLNAVNVSILSFAQMQLEWMSSAINEKFQSNRENPFSLRSFHLCQKKAEVLDKFPGPKVVLCSMPSLFSGDAQELFIEWASDARNRIIFTDRSRPNTPARRLMENPKMGVMWLERWTRVPLSGVELEEFEKKKRIEQEAELAKKRVAEEKMKKRRENIQMYDYEGEDANLTASLSTLWQSHDLYVKALDAPKDGSSLPFPMFPCIERRSVYDDFGEAIRPEDFKLAVETAIEDSEAIDLDEDQEEGMDLEADIPNKCIFETVKVTVNCGIQYLDFEGRSDGRSIKNILSRYVRPRKMILIHGTSEATNHLADYFRKMPEPPKMVVAPHIGETVDVSEATDVYRIHLNTNFLESLEFVSIGSEGNVCQIAYVDGRVMIPLQDEDNPWHKPEPYLDVLPKYQSDEGHAAILVGDIKLSNFRQTLQQQGFTAEFKGDRVLVVNGTIGLRREAESETPTIEMEGGISEDYYKVRDLLFKELQIL